MANFGNDFGKVYLSPNERDPIKQDGVVRQIIEYFRRTQTGSFYSDLGANIIRLADRLFVGEAADNFAGTSSVTTSSLDSGTSWLSDKTKGPSFLGHNAQFLVTTNTSSGPSQASYAVVGAATGQEPIGVAGAVENNLIQSAWAFYGDLTQTVDGQTLGLEIAAKNASGVNHVPFPHASVNGVYALWCQAGGDNSYGPASNVPSGACLAFIKGSQTWNVGILAREDSLTDGEAMKLSSVGVGGAHRISWWDASNTLRGFVRSSQSSRQYHIDMTDSNIAIGEVTPFLINEVASSSNNFLTNGSSAGGAPSITTYGSDTDIDLFLAPKGAGNVRFGSFTSSTTTNVGYITVKDASNTVRKLMVGN